jgi:hypothetical protein
MVPNTKDDIEKVIAEIKDLLLAKNKAYGDSALSQGRLFPIDPIISIQSRINDKLERIANKGINDDTEDTIDDLIGYLVLLKIARERAKQNN